MNPLLRLTFPLSLTITLAGCSRRPAAQRSPADQVEHLTATAVSEPALAPLPQPAEQTATVPGQIRYQDLPPATQARKAKLLVTVGKLTTYEADLVCLVLGLIPREEVFDDDTNPKKRLTRYASHAISDDDLKTIESALAQLRR